MGFCLPFKEVEKFVKALKDGVIDPAKLSTMTSVERRSFFEDIVGKEDAKEVNALFESKLLLKNQQAGMISWAKKVGGISEVVRRDIISRIEKMTDVLDPKEQAAFLGDLAASKLGTEVSFEEAKTIANLSRQLTESRSNLKEESPIRSDERLDYGSKKVALQNYIDELRLGNEKKTVGEILKQAKVAPVGTILESASKIAGFTKGIKASLDNSAIFRQGWKTLFTNPKIWAKNALKSFVDISSQIVKKPSDSQIIDGVKADIYSRPNAIDGTYQKMKLDIGELEEAFPTTLPEKLPLFGRLYKASETAYTGFLYRMRADIADRLVDIAKKSDVDLTDPVELRSIGKLTNSLTGRGDLGAFEKVGKQVNTIFFSPKMMKSTFDFLTLHGFEKMSPFARKQAALNALKVISGIATILATAKAINSNSVELDPRSADFGKIRVGDTRFDVTGGMSSMVTLAARLIKQSTKSSTSGKITQLNTGKFGSRTSGDVFVDFLSNKLSPATSFVKDLINQKDFDGNPITVGGELKNLFVPLPITNLEESLNNPNSANTLLVGIADALGISTNTYSLKKK